MIKHTHDYQDRELTISNRLLTKLKWIAAARNAGRTDREVRLTADSIAEEMLAEAIEGESSPYLPLTAIYDQRRELYDEGVARAKQIVDPNRNLSKASPVPISVLDEDVPF